MEFDTGSLIGGIILGFGLGMQVYRMLVAWVIGRAPLCKEDIHEFAQIKGWKKTTRIGNQK